MRNGFSVGADGMLDPSDGGALGALPPGSTSAGDPGLLVAVGDLGVIFQSPAPPTGASTGGTPDASPAPVSGTLSPFVINVIYDTSVNNAPTGFKTGIQAAV